ncbi:MAG: pyridoxal kinase [Alphaproteobacteria bacterium]
MPNVISIQSQVAFGCAGNTAAVPILQRLGVTVWPVPTTLLSNTPIYPRLEGGPVKAARLAAILDGLLERAGDNGVDAVLTGYIASPENARAVAGFLDRARRTNPDMIYLCDPVMGDARKGLYVPDKVTEAITETLAPKADIITPNLFEAMMLTNSEVPEPPALAQRIAGSIDGIAVIKNVPGNGLIENLASGRQQNSSSTCNRIDAHFAGTGDAFSAAFLGFYLRDRDVAAALEQATALVFALIDEANALGLKELDFGVLRGWERTV